MKFSHFFVDRPIFAAVIAILITLIGGMSYVGLPIQQYPEVAPPTIQVSASYPGASAEVVADTVATPLEQEINGVENMLYMSSQSTGDGRVSITVTFALGTDLDAAQVLVQNRVAVAESRLPEEVRRLGVTTVKRSPDMLMVVNMNSPDESVDQLYLSNYTKLNITDVLSRLGGVGNVIVFGSADYSMRIWLDPPRLEARRMTVSDVLEALRAQNVQVSSGVLNTSPMPDQGAFEVAVQTLGRLIEPEQFGDVVVKTDAQGRVTRLADVARIELGAQNYVSNSYLDGKKGVALGIFQRPGSNALATAEEVKATLERLSKDFPPGIAYAIPYNPTQFVEESVSELTRTIFEAVALVIIVIVLFLQSWRAAIIPIVAIPVSLIGTFGVMAALGFSLNTLSLFGLVLAIGIVVDDAIVVVENVERHLREGLSPYDAAHKTMDEVGSALVSIVLVLSAVFIPTAFIPGISGAFYQQFAVTIATAVAISGLISLTLSPALARLLLRREEAEEGGGPLRRAANRFFTRFNTSFEALSGWYSDVVARAVRVSAMMLLIYGGLIGLTVLEFAKTPTGFIPEQDQGYFIGVVQLPPGSALSRTDDVVRRASRMAVETPGVNRVTGYAGFDGATFTNAPNTGAMFISLRSFDERADIGVGWQDVLQDLQRRFASIREATIFVVVPPPVRGVGTGGGFKMMVEDRQGRGLPALEAAAQNLAMAANGLPEATRVFTLFNTKTPQIYADIDRVKAEKLGVPVSRVFETLGVYIGSSYVNDFNFLGRTFQVRAQADGPHRRDVDDVAALRTRSQSGAMVPLGSIATFRDITGPYRVARYNLYPAAAVQGNTNPGFSTGQTLSAMEGLADQVLPDGFDYEWTELSFQEKQVGNTAIYIFMAAVVFVFLVLAAQYESWLLPLAIILIVPMCLLAAMSGVLLRGLDNNILVQIGLVVLIGLAAKNAILIVEFARQGEAEGLSRFDAAAQAARTRLRPILMTSFAFILGVVPLVIAAGAGAEQRQALGTAVFSGMIGVTLFGLLFTPVFYVATRALARRRDGE